MNTYILIADGSRANLFHRRGRDFNLIESWSNEDGRKQPHELNTDKDFQRQGWQSGYEPHVDAQRHSQQLFAKKLAGVLNERERHYDSLVVAATPKILGDLRSEYRREVREKIYCETDKEYTHVPLHELPSLLRPILP